jgi:hypothetical protein
MNRREFLKFSSCGLTFVAVGTTSLPAFWQGTSQAFAQISSRLDLEMVEVLAEMVDGVAVPMWAFKIDNGSDTLPAGARIPGPALIAFEGERIRVRITNNIPNGGLHSFVIPGVIDSGPIAFGDDETVEFAAPTAGTYMYLDGLNAPVNRVMGLHGVLVVLPSPVRNFTPYSTPTESVRRLFGDLGTTDHFPGRPWTQGRNAVWVFNTVDPDKNAAAAASSSGINSAAFLGGYLPQYFTINGKSGFFSAQHHDHHGDLESGHDEIPLNFSGRFSAYDLQANVSFGGRIGEPMLIRNVNAGLMWHSPHIHGNHLYEIAENGTIKENLLLLDTWTLPPLACKDLLHPFIRPPDIPANFWERVKAGTNQEKFPLLYPMHDHNEISNTAAGANYPHGMVTHWQIDGDVDPHAAVIRVDRADLRVRSGHLDLEGSNSTPHIELAIHAGGHGGPMIGHVHVGGDGRWSFRGRGLKTLSSRMVTLVFHDADNHDIVRDALMVPLNLR